MACSPYRAPRRSAICEASGSRSPMSSVSPAEPRDLVGDLGVRPAHRRGRVSAAQHPVQGRVQLIFFRARPAPRSPRSRHRLRGARRRVPRAAHRLSRSRRAAPSLATRRGTAGRSWGRGPAGRSGRVSDRPFPGQARQPACGQARRGQYQQHQRRTATQPRPCPPASTPHHAPSLQRGRRDGPGRKARLSGPFAPLRE